MVERLFLDFGKRNLVGGDVDDFAVFPENHGDSGAAVLKDGFAEGAAESGIDALPVSAPRFPLRSA